MPQLKATVPSYRRKRSRSGRRWLAVAVFDGREVVLGTYRSPDSYRRYQDELHQWLANRLDADQQSEASLTVGELADQFLAHCRRYYRKGGKVTREAGLVDSAWAVMVESHAEFSADECGARVLGEVRQKMITRGWSRSFVNKQIDRIKRGFRWAVEGEILEAGPKYHSLVALRSLAKGRSPAPEPPPVRPVHHAVIRATLAHLGPVVADMVRVQRLLGCRPGELVALRPVDIQRDGAAWRYTPRSHKSEHIHDRRVIFIGPRAQEILAKYLRRPPEHYCFSPVEAEQRRRSLLHAQRRTPQSCGNRPGSNRKAKPRRRPGSGYSVGSYRRAIARACAAAKVEHWSPHRLRHTAATDVRRQFGLEAAQVILGHTTASVTEVYAERDMLLAQRVASQIG